MGRANGKACSVVFPTHWKKLARGVTTYTNQKKNKMKMRVRRQFEFNQHASSFSRGGPTWHVRDGNAQHGVTWFYNGGVTTWDDAPLPHSGLLTPLHVKYILIFYPHLLEYKFTPYSLRGLVKQWLSRGVSRILSAGWLTVITGPGAGQWCTDTNSTGLIGS